MWIDDDLVVLDPLTALRRYLPKVQERADVVILLSNLGWAANAWLAQQVPGLDLVVSAGPGDLNTRPWMVPAERPSSARGGNG